MAEDAAQPQATYASTDTVSSEISCCCSNKGDRPGHLYGECFPVFCFVHNLVTPQAKWRLGALKGDLFVPSAVGVARTGKSTNRNRLVTYLKRFIASAPETETKSLDMSAETIFPVSSACDPCTIGIHAVLFPRFCDFDGAQLGQTNGNWLVVDAEGTNLGNTEHHQTMLGLLTRFSTHLSFFAIHHFDFDMLKGIDRLVSSNLIANKPSSGTKFNGTETPETTAAPSAPDAGAPSAAASVYWPHLALVINQAALDPPQPSHLAWITAQLQDQAGQTATNTIRTTIRHKWLSLGKLSYHTIPVATSLKLAPEVLAMVPENALRAMDAGMNTACDILFSEIIAAPALSMDAFSTRGGSGGSGVLGEASSQGKRSFNGSFLCKTLDFLIATYSETSTIEPESAMESAVKAICTQTMSEVGEALKMALEEKTNKLSIALGENDIDGARGTVSDLDASKVLETVKERFDKLAAKEAEAFDEALAAYAGLGLDPVIAAQKTNLAALSDTYWKPIKDHWDGKRRFVSITTETGTWDTPTTNRVHHTENQQIWFHTVTHYFWASYVHRFNRSRTKSVRGNGDVVYGEWVLGASHEVMTAGPWLGGKP